MFLVEKKRAVRATASQSGTRRADLVAHVLQTEAAETFAPYNRFAKLLTRAAATLLGHAASLTQKVQAVEAARKYGRICQLGTQQRSDPMQAAIKQFLHEEKALGEIAASQLTKDPMVIGAKGQLESPVTSLPLTRCGPQCSTLRTY